MNVIDTTACLGLFSIILEIMTKTDWCQIMSYEKMMHATSYENDQAICSDEVWDVHTCVWGGGGEGGRGGGWILVPLARLY